MLDFINNGKEWIFSGIGVPIIVAFFGVLGKIFYNKSKNSDNLKYRMSQRSKKNSNNIQIGKIDLRYSNKEDR